MMQEFTTTVTRKGQITVPVEIRRSLGLKEGDKVAVSIPDPAKPQASLRPVASVADRTYGAMKWRGRKISLEEEESAFADAAVEEELELLRRADEGRE